MSNPFVAEIRIMPYNFAPVGWAFCNGQLMPISQNTALFSLIGTFYGGDGKSNFALPNFQGSAALSSGQGPGLSIYDVGQSGGSAEVTLLVSEIPAHAHTVNCLAGNGDKPTTAGDGWAKVASGRGSQNLYAASPNGTTMSQQGFAPAGGNQPHNNMAPYLALSFCIALQGIFPARS